MRLRVFVFVILSGLLYACGGSKSTVDPPAPLQTLSTNPPITTAWRANTGAGHKKERLALSPSLSGDTLISVSPRGHVRAFDAHSGAARWQQRLSTDISAPAAIADGVVVVAGQRGDLYGLRAQDGSEIWRAQTSSEVLARPAINAQFVSVRTVDGKLTTFSAKEGVRLWTYEQSVPILSLRGTSAPVFFQDLVFSGFDNGRVTALDAQTGKPRWEVQVTDARGRTELERMVDIDMAPLIHDYALYIATYQGHIAAFSLSNGDILWKKEISSYGDLAVDNNALYLSDSKGHVWAFERRSGDTLWKQDQLHDRQLSAPVIHGDYLVVGDLEGYLHWLRRDNGAQAGRLQVSKAPFHAPALTFGEMLVAQNSDGSLIAVGLKQE
jgi:outer membrane protein assembly factor BamB